MLRLGRRGDASFPWSSLLAVRTGAARVDLDFSGETVELSVVSPQAQFVALVDAARRHLGVPPSDTAAELSELARRKLGRMAALGNEAAIAALPDLLEDGEVVERLAQATLDFTGLLAVTNRRILLSAPALRRGRDRLWSVPRADVLDAVPDEADIRLELASGPVLLRDVAPHGRAAELVAVLGRRG